MVAHSYRLLRETLVANFFLRLLKMEEVLPDDGDGDGDTPSLERLWNKLSHKKLRSAEKATPYVAAYYDPESDTYATFRMIRALSYYVSPLLAFLDRGLRTSDANSISQEWYGSLSECIFTEEYHTCWAVVEKICETQPFAPASFVHVVQTISDVMKSEYPSLKKYSVSFSPLSSCLFTSS